MSGLVFISYSRRDERWKGDLVGQLGVLEREGLLASWHDGLIQPGADWLPEIESAMAEARVAVCIISADFLNSEFIRREEIPALMERRQKQGLRVIPLIARQACRGSHLSSPPLRAPEDANPLAAWAGRRRERGRAGTGAGVAGFAARAVSRPTRRFRHRQNLPPPRVGATPGAGRGYWRVAATTEQCACGTGRADEEAS